MNNSDAGTSPSASSFDLEPHSCAAASFGGSAASQMSMFLLGDYYSELEEKDPTRGVSFAPNELPIDVQKPQGNYYSELDEVTTGFSLDEGMLSDHFQSSLHNEDNKFTVVTHESTRFENFQMPPDVPTDPHFKLMPTTCICRCSAAECMNRLLDFFETEVISAVTKLCRAKFVIKVDVFDKGIMMCSLKFRMYRQLTGEFAVEFQRRSGDTVAFHKVYQQACLKLDPRLTCAEFFAGVTPPLDQLEGLSSIAELSPLVDMLSLFNSPELQAEAAACLANIASGNPASVVVMCSEHIFEHLKNLLQIDRIDVAYPIACLLSSLAACTAAKTLLADYGLVPAMEEQIQSAQKTTLVKDQLGAAVHAWCQPGL